MPAMPWHRRSIEPASSRRRRSRRRATGRLARSRARLGPAGFRGVEPQSLPRFLRRVGRVGRIAPVAPNGFFLPETIVRLADLAADLAAESPEQSFTAALFKDRSGIGRNLTIEVLEYLDQIGVTRRVGDARIVLRPAAELFG